MSNSSKQIGTLVVVVLKARNLNNVSFYKQSPYTLIRFGGGGQCTKEDYKGGQHPVWDEELRFPVLGSTQEQLENGRPLALRVAVFTKGKRTDERLGEGEVRIDEVLHTGEFDGWIPLSVDGKQRGEIYLELTYFPMAQSLTRRPSKLGPTDRLWRPRSPNSQDTPSSPRYPSSAASQPPFVSAGTLRPPPSSISPEPSPTKPPTPTRPPYQSNQDGPSSTSQSLELPPHTYQQLPYSIPSPTASSGSRVASMPSILRPGNQRYAGGRSPPDPASALSLGVSSPYTVSQEDVRASELREREEFFARRKRQEEEDAELARRLFEEEEREPGSNIPGGWVE